MTTQFLRILNTLRLVTPDPQSGHGRDAAREPAAQPAIDIFLSYSSQDELVARPLQAKLAVAGYRVFWDQEVPAGQDWDRWIRTRLRDSRLVIVLWSKASLVSPNVRHEAMLGMEAGKLLPILIDDIKPSDLPMGLYLVQSLKLIGGPDRDPDGFARLLAVLDARLGSTSAASHAVSVPPIGVPPDGKNRVTTSSGTAVPHTPSSTLAPRGKHVPALLVLGAFVVLGVPSAVAIFIVFGTKPRDPRGSQAIPPISMNVAQATAQARTPPETAPSLQFTVSPDAAPPAQPPRLPRTWAQEPRKTEVVQGQSFVQLGTVQTEDQAQRMASQQATALAREVCFYRAGGLFATAIRLPTREAEKLRDSLVLQGVRGIADPPGVFPGTTYEFLGCEH